MSFAIFLISALFGVTGKALWRSARNRTLENANTQILLSCVAWLLACIFALVAVLAIAHAQEALPINPDVTQENIHQTVCVPNWDKPVRPSVAVTNRIKFAKMDSLGIPRSRTRELELDHVISLVLAGAPQDPRNLRLQEWYGDPVATPRDADGLDTQAHLKDVLEVRLHKLVCSGQLSLADAQACIFNDWRECALKFPAKGKK